MNFICIYVKFFACSHPKINQTQTQTQNPSFVLLATYLRLYLFTYIYIFISIYTRPLCILAYNLLRPLRTSFTSSPARDLHLISFRFSFLPPPKSSQPIGSLVATYFLCVFFVFYFRLSWSSESLLCLPFPIYFSQSSP